MVWEALALASTPSIKGPLRILRKIISSTWHVLVANTVCGRASQSSRVLTEPCVIEFIMIRQTFMNAKSFFIEYPLRILRKIFSNTRHEFIANAIFRRANK